MSRRTPGDVAPAGVTVRLATLDDAATIAGIHEAAVSGEHGRMAARPSDP